MTTANARRGDFAQPGWLAYMRLWGARVELVAKAEAVVEEFAQAAEVLARGPAEVTAQYDEIALQLDFTWTGDALPGARDMRIEPEHGAARLQLPLAAAMIRHQADHLAVSRLGDGRQRLCVTLDDL